MEKFIVNPKTGKPYVYMSKPQAQAACVKRGGVPYQFRPGGGFFLLTEQYASEIWKGFLTKVTYN